MVILLSLREGMLIMNEDDKKLLTSLRNIITSHEPPFNDNVWLMVMERLIVVNCELFSTGVFTDVSKLLVQIQDGEIQSKHEINKRIDEIESNFEIKSK